MLQMMADWLRIAAEIAIERRHSGGLFVNNVAAVGIILIGGDRKETEQESEKHEKTRQRDSDHIICAPILMNPGMNRRARQENADPGDCEKHGAEQQPYFPARIIINPIHHAASFAYPSPH